MPLTKTVTLTVRVNKAVTFLAIVIEFTLRVFFAFRHTDFKRLRQDFKKNNGELCCVVDDIPNTHWEYRPVLENHPSRY